MTIYARSSLIVSPARAIGSVAGVTLAVWQGIAVPRRIRRFHAITTYTTSGNARHRRALLSPHATSATSKWIAVGARTLYLASKLVFWGIVPRPTRLAAPSNGMPILPNVPHLYVEQTRTARVV